MLAGAAKTFSKASPESVFAKDFWELRSVILLLFAKKTFVAEFGKILRKQSPESHPETQVRIPRDAVEVCLGAWGEELRAKGGAGQGTIWDYLELFGPCAVGHLAGHSHVLSGCWYIL